MLAYIALYCRDATHGEPFLQTTGSHHEVTFRGKCNLRRKKREFLSAFNFWGILFPSTPWEVLCEEAWEGWEPTEEGKEPTFPTPIISICDVLVVRNKMGKGKKKPKSSLKEGITWNWTQELHTKDVKLVGNQQWQQESPGSQGSWRWVPLQNILVPWSHSQEKRVLEEEKDKELGNLQGRQWWKYEHCSTRPLWRQDWQKAAGRHCWPELHAVWII